VKSGRKKGEPATDDREPLAETVNTESVCENSLVVKRK
jgi:hypothetical protein